MRNSKVKTSQLASLDNLRDPIPIYIEQNIKRGMLDILDAEYAKRAQAVSDGLESAALAAALFYRHGRASGHTARVFGLRTIANRVEDETDRLVLLLDPDFNRHTEDRLNGSWRQTWLN